MTFMRGNKIWAQIGKHLAHEKTSEVFCSVSTEPNSDLRQQNFNFLEVEFLMTTSSYSIFINKTLGLGLIE